MSGPFTNKVTGVAISPYLAHLRARIGHDLVLLPAAAALARDDQGRVLLVRHFDTGLWSTIGGSVEPDESPWDTAVREAAEEAGVTVTLSGLRCVMGGPDFRVTYPNGDVCSYVAIVFDARVVAGEPRPDGEETIEVGWFAPSELAGLELDRLNRALLSGCGVMGGA
jgi:8-oxo-dGTP pyrophosphatase MutT (NUDIX family)